VLTREPQIHRQRVGSETIANMNHPGQPARPARRKLPMKTRLEQRIAASTKDRVLTPYLTIGGLLLTVIGIAGGVWLAHQPVSQAVPGSRTGPWPFLGNVLANLVLIGPALVITNYLVPYVQRTRSDNRAEHHLGMIGLILTSSIKVANDYLATLGSEKRCAAPRVITSDGTVDLRGELAAIDDAIKAIDQASEYFAAKNVDNPPLSLPINEESLSFDLPNFAAVQTVVGLLDREIHCPFGVLSASAAEHFSRHCYIDFVWQGQGSIFRAPGEEPKRVMQPKIGFSEIRVWMLRAGRTTSGPVTRITIGIATYHDFVYQCLYRSRTIIEQIIDCCPERLLARPQPTGGAASEPAKPAEPEPVSTSE
jgi:hypothetical protein